MASFTYFEGCCSSSLQFIVNQTSWTSSGGTTTIGSVYSFSGDNTVPNGCYTIVASSGLTTGYTPTNFTLTTGASYQLQSGCTSIYCYTGNCCSNTLCLNIQNSTYGGYSGTYTMRGARNAPPRPALFLRIPMRE